MENIVLIILRLCMIVLGGLIIGLVIMLYGQLKYNKGIF